MTKDKAERRITIRLYPADLETLNDIKQFLEWTTGNKVSYATVIRKALFAYLYEIQGLNSYTVYRIQTQKETEKVRKGEEEA